MMKKKLERNQTDIFKETYSLEWIGKSYAKVLATEPVRTFIKENEEWNERKENKNSKNVLIKGDNLEALKHLVNIYENRLKKNIIPGNPCRVRTCNPPLKRRVLYQLS